VVISDSINVLNDKNVLKLLLHNKQQALLDEIQKYRKEAAEFELMIEATPNALVVLDKAYPSATNFKPNKVLVLSIVCFVALFFSILLVLFIEGRKN